VKDKSNRVADLARETIRLEINGRGFFDHAAEVTHNELGKKMFRKLAQDEIRHLDTFRQLFSSIIGKEEWKNFVEEEQESQSSVIEELKSRIRKEQKAGKLEAISIGMELERKAIDFFEKSGVRATDPTLKEMFIKICEEERLHYTLLQAQYDSVTNSGFWLDVAEFRMDGKY
jgi:rubrerythrin